MKERILWGFLEEVQLELRLGEMGVGRCKRSGRYCGEGEWK